MADHLDTMLTPAALAKRWGMTVPGLRNLRTRGQAPAWVRLPGGAFRYPLAGVIQAELFGRHAFCDLPAVLRTLAAVDGLSNELLAAIEVKLTEAYARHE
jgi:hypothetical protein